MTMPVPVVDIFAGCGGLGEGFSRKRPNGRFPFDVKLSIESEAAPIKTLQLRSFYHQFRSTEVPEDYYKYLRGEIDREEMFVRHARESNAALERCLQAELGNPELEQEVHDSIASSISGRRDWVLIGGPPCQAYSVAGRSRNQSISSYDPDSDGRFELYREYLKIITDHWPAVFVMENVKGLLSASYRNRLIFGRMKEDLREPMMAFPKLRGRSSRNHRYRLYSLTARVALLGDPVESSSPTDFVIKSERFGIPQARHRVVLVGVRDDISAIPDPLLPNPKTVDAAKVLDGLPRLRSGLSRRDTPEGWVKAVKAICGQPWWNQIETSMRSLILKALDGVEVPPSGRGALRFLDMESDCDFMPEWFLDHRLRGTLNHRARGHREDDLWRYAFAACAQQTRNHPFRLRDFPPGLRPNHRNVESSLACNSFSDRFSVQRKVGPSRTVVSHIRKDGHYYIHYDATQCRSLTVREAARLQTFPDNFFFEGTQTDQFGQVGNAVPPLLSYQIADRIAELLGQTAKEAHGHNLG